MSTTTTEPSSLLTSRGKLITFGIGALLGIVVFSLATNAATLAYSSLAIGNITRYDQFKVGSWFRYDFGDYTSGTGQPPERSFYVVTTIEGIVTAGNSTWGDPLVASQLGDGEAWYNWSIKAYWMTGVEAVELYGKNNTGNQLWDSGVRFLFEGYAKRHTYTVADTTITTQDHTPVITRPQFVSAYSTGETVYSNTTAFTTGKFSHRKLVGGVTLFDCYRSDYPASAYRYSIINYDKSTGLLLFMVFSTDVSNVEWGMTQYSAGIRYLPVTDPSRVPVPLFDFVKGIDSSNGYIVFPPEQAYRSWWISIVSSNTSIVKNMSLTRFVESSIPINVTGVGTTVINVTVIGDYFGINSSAVTKSFVITASAPPSPDKVGKTTITSVLASDSTITVSWAAVEYANEYLVYANDTFVGKTGATSFAFHPTVSGNYSIFVVVTSVVNASSSDPSDIKYVMYNRTAAIFVGEPAKFEPSAPFDYVPFLIVVILVVVAIVVTYLLSKRGIIMKSAPKVGGAKRGQPVSRGKKKATPATTTAARRRT
jgi:hypothetical protein